MDELELIDFDKKGNVVRLYFGNNGEQKGDDWNDRPYEHNAGTVYPEFVKGTVDLFIPFDIDVKEPADEQVNSPFCKNDFIHKKSWVLWVEQEYGDEGRDPVGIFFGDTLKEIQEKLSPYHPLYKDVGEWVEA